MQRNETIMSENDCKTMKLYSNVRKMATECFLRPERRKSYFVVGVINDKKIESIQDALFELMKRIRRITYRPSPRSGER